MSKRNPKPLLIDMLQSIEKIQDYTSGMSYESFLADFKTKDAVTRKGQILEAANKIPESIRNQTPVLNGPKLSVPGISSLMIMMILIMPLSGKSLQYI